MDFDNFVRASGPDLMRLAWLLTGSQSAAEDLMQSAYIKVLPRWKTISGYDDPLAYMRKTLVTTRISLWRRTNRETLVPDQLDTVTADGTGVVDDVDCLVRALNSLGRRQRSVVVLRYYADLSEAETADLLSISIGTVKSQATRGLSHLRDVMNTSESTVQP